MHGEGGGTGPGFSPGSCRAQWRSHAGVGAPSRCFMGKAMPPPRPNHAVEQKDLLLTNEGATR